MRSIITRGGAIALSVLCLLGADIALAGEGVMEATRMPFGDSLIEHERVTVVAGDHLWKISKRHLQERAQRSISNSEIGPYWRTVIEHNLGRLRSGDPDLIYPGEVIELPEAGITGQP